MSGIATYSPDMPSSPRAPGRLSDDLRRVARAVASAHERFVAQGQLTESVVRSVVADSWRRSADRGVDPAADAAPLVLSDADLAVARDSAPWAAAVPLVRSLLSDAATAAGHVVALGDADGRLLWVEGASTMRRRAEGMGFSEGALWSEEAAGTNAPGTALAIDQPVQIRTHEHFVGAVQRWSCTAVPIHDPVDGRVVGVLDVTGDDEVASPMALAMVRATVAAVEQSLLAAPRPAAGAVRSRLEVLGRERAVLSHGGRTVRLSARHSELLLLLSMYPDGLSGERLQTMLHERDVSPVTLRAELTRLRKILGTQMLISRPYRLSQPLTTDAGEVMAAMDRGDIAAAVRGYRGPVLPASEAPAIAELRGEVRARMRRAALAGTDPDVLLAFAGSDDGRDDVEVLRAALRHLPAKSPKRLGVAARIDRVDSLYGFPAPRSGPVAPRR